MQSGLKGCSRGHGQGALSRVALRGARSVTWAARIESPFPTYSSGLNRRTFSSSRVSADTKKRDFLPPEAEVVGSQPSPAKEEPPKPRIPKKEEPVERILKSSASKETISANLEQQRRERERGLVKEAEKLAKENEKIKGELEKLKSKNAEYEEVIRKQIKEDIKKGNIKDKTGWHPDMIGPTEVPFTRKTLGQNLWESGREVLLLASLSAVFIVLYRLSRMQGEYAEHRRVSQWALEDTQFLLTEHRKAVKNKLTANLGEIEEAVVSALPVAGSSEFPEQQEERMKEALSEVLNRLLSQVESEGEANKRKLPRLQEGKRPSARFPLPDLRSSFHSTQRPK